jgi:cytochrome P450
MDEHPIDHNEAKYAGPFAVRVAAWSQVRQACPVAYSPRHGGYWVLSDHASVALASRDSETFSHRYAPDAEDGIDYIGESGIPRPAYPELGIGEAYGEHHRYLRRVLNPFFMPPAVRVFEPAMRQAASWALDQHIAKGSLDLIDDYIAPVTAISTLSFMGLPTGQWRETSEMFHAALGYKPGSAEHERVVSEQMPALVDALVSATRTRRDDPRDDVLTAIAQLQIDGQLFNDDELAQILFNIVGGGVDTTNNLTGRSLRHLGAQRRLRRQLIEDPALIEPACEEFLRLYPSVVTLTRTLTADISLGELTLRRGDHVLIAHAAANRDPAEFPDPDDFDLQRFPNRQLSFGLGVHRCLGAHVARQIFRVMASEVLRRIPDYMIDESGVREYTGGSSTTGLWSLPATFTPGQSLDTPQPW